MWMAEVRAQWQRPISGPGLCSPPLTFLGKNILNYLNSTVSVQFYAFLRKVIYVSENKSGVLSAESSLHQLCCSRRVAWPALRVGWEERRFVLSFPCSSQSHLCQQRPSVMLVPLALSWYSYAHIPRGLKKGWLFPGVRFSFQPGAWNLEAMGRTLWARKGGLWNVVPWPGGLRLWTGPVHYRGTLGGDVLASAHLGRRRQAMQAPLPCPTGHVTSVSLSV